jgi:ribosomal protein S18 acetylase RimI-like enzyme
MATIRDFTPADESPIRALAPRLNIPTGTGRDPAMVDAAILGWIEESIQRARTDPGQLKVAVDGEVLVGFVTLETRQHWSGDHDAHVGELVVAASHEGRGIGTALLDAAKRWAQAQGCSRLSLMTGASNARARALYAKLGFLEDDVVLSISIQADEPPL